MTSRERVLRAFHHEETDRVPFNMRFAPDLARKVRKLVRKEDLEAYFDYDIRFIGYASDQRTPDFSEYLGEIPENSSVSPWGVASVQGNFLHFSRRINPTRHLTADDLDGYPWPRYEPKIHEMRTQVKEIQASGYAAVSQYEYSKDTLDGLLFENCSGCTFSGFHFVDTLAEAVVILRNCAEVNMTGCQILDPQNIGVLLENSHNCRVSNCIILDRRELRTMQETIKVIGGSSNVTMDNMEAPE